MTNCKARLSAFWRPRPVKYRRHKLASCLLSLCVETQQGGSGGGVSFTSHATHAEALFLVKSSLYISATPLHTNYSNSWRRDCVIAEECRLQTTRVVITLSLDITPHKCFVNSRARSVQLGGTVLEFTHHVRRVTGSKIQTKTPTVYEIKWKISLLTRRG